MSPAAEPVLPQGAGYGAGGMRSTLLCHYTHTTVLFAIILVFVFTVYATSPKIGSPAAMHALLTSAAAANPVSGNAQGSYVSMRSKNGLPFGVINIIGNFATVFQAADFKTLEALRGMTKILSLGAYSPIFRLAPQR